MRRTKLVLISLIIVILCGIFAGCEKSLFNGKSISYKGTVDEKTYLEDGIAYKEVDGEYSVVEVHPDLRYVEIPEEVNGFTVTQIKDVYFSSLSNLFGGSNLCSIVIPSSIKKIESGAFYCCEKLVEVCNLSKIEIELGSEKEGDAGYYAKDIYTTKDYVSKISTSEDGFIIYNNGEDVILLGYEGNNDDLVLPSNITEIRGVITDNIHSLEITEPLPYEWEIDYTNQPLEKDVYLEAYACVLLSDSIGRTIYANIENGEIFSLYIDNIEAVKAYAVLGEITSNIFVYVKDDLVIPDEIMTIQRKNENENDEEIIEVLEYIPYGTKEHNNNSYTRYIVKINGELVHLPEDKE